MNKEELLRKYEITREPESAVEQQNEYGKYIRRTLLDVLKTLAESSASGGGDIENNHWKADQALLSYIDDPEISEAFWSIEKWYS